jgi:hypothetical protein
MTPFKLNRGRLASDSRVRGVFSSVEVPSFSGPVRETESGFANFRKTRK